MTTETNKNGAMTLSRMNFSGYVGHVTIFSWMHTIRCCSAGTRTRIGHAWLVSGYEHVFTLLCVVIAPYPCGGGGQIWRVYTA